MELKKLSEPFPESEIEWRIGQAGKKGNGQIWATCLAYVQSRAIMNRLDDVCGPHQWKVSYRTIVGSQGIAPGVICELSILCGDTWVTKEDGAEQTDIESFKGGISAALKRAGVAWGIGRYLYNLEQGFAQIVQSGGTYGKTKDGTEFYWTPPALPKWALPAGQQSNALPQIKPQQPAAGDGFSDDSYRIPFGKFSKRSLEEVDLNELRSYVLYLENKAEKDGKKITGVVADFIERASAHIVAFENGPVE